MVDARIVRTRNGLAEAVIDLAGTTRVSRISVAELARRAGINRATFYDHYSSPSELLAETLAAEFSAMQAKYLQLHGTERTPESALRIGLRGLLEHVEGRRGIYQRALGTSPDPEVASVLTEMFSAACFGVLQNITTPTMPSTRANVVARYAAAASIAAIGYWLEDPELSREELVEVLADALPKWWR